MKLAALVLCLLTSTAFATGGGHGGGHGSSSGSGSSGSAGGSSTGEGGGASSADMDPRFTVKYIFNKPCNCPVEVKKSKKKVATKQAKVCK